MSSQPTACVLAALALLLPLSAAWAQPQWIPGRRMTVSGRQAELAPEIHALPGVTTVVLFDAEIDPASVQVDLTRIKLVDVRGWSLLFVPLLEMGPGERLGLRVRYVDGAAPEEAHFAIVSRPPMVDPVLSVARRHQSLAECQAELAQARASCSGSEAAVWELVRRLNEKGATAHRIHPSDKAKGGIRGAGGHAYRFATGLLLTVAVDNAQGQPPWMPESAALTCKRTRASVKANTVSTKSGTLAEGGGDWVAVETELPLATAGPDYTLELRGADGRTLNMKVKLPPTPREEPLK